MILYSGIVWGDPGLACDTCDIEIMRSYPSYCRSAMLVEYLNIDDQISLFAVGLSRMERSM